MKRKIRHIAMMILLLIAGAQNGAWADVTYHILTMPFTTYGSTANTVKKSNIRVEAIRCTSSETTVGLPAAFKTPLMEDDAYSYYKAVTAPTHETLYGSNNTYYDVYISDCCSEDNRLTAGAAVPDGVTDIYVTYDYTASKKTGTFDLTGGTMYNITMKSGSTTYFYGAHYKQSWGNRTENVKASNYTGSYLDCLASNDMVKTDKDSYGRNLGWYLKGNDPYNIRLVTGYTGTLKADNRCPMKDSFVWAQVNPGAGTSQSMWLFTDTLTNYRNMLNLFVSFLLLNHNNGEDYTMIGSNLNSTWGANGRTVVHPYNGKYFHLQHNTNDTGPRILPVTPADATPLQFYEVRDYKFNVTTPFYDSGGTAEQKAAHTVSATKKWSDYGLTASMTTDDVPDSLDRKYCTYDGLYKEAAQTNAISTYQDAYDNGRQIYVKYTAANMPFEALDTDGSYSNATWYELTDKDDSDNDKKIAWDTENTTFKNNASDYAKVNEFAFIGDPYELQVIHRSTSTSANSYVGAASEGNLGVIDATTFASSSTGYVWEIPYDAVSGNLVLREYKTIKAPNYWKWDASSSGNAVTKASDDSTRIKVIELPQYTYYYNIVDKAGNIAVRASATQTIFSPLNYSSIPEIIRSPFIYGEDLKFYTTYPGGGRGNLSGQITETTTTANDEIYVKYYTTNLSSKPAQLSQSQEFNVILNGEYIYYDNGTIKSKASPTDDELNSNAFLWRIRGRDPYAMIIDNKVNAASPEITESVTIYSDEGVTSSEDLNVGTWVKKDDNNSLAFTSTRTDATRFVALSSTQTGYYEVMYAAGSSYDASATTSGDHYFNIGRENETTTKVYSNQTYQHGADGIKFQLLGRTSYTYKLIDLNENVLLTKTTKAFDLVLPSELQSPLVGEYKYWKRSQVTVSGDTYTVKSGETAITSTAAAATGETAAADGSYVIYVTYTPGTLVKYNDPSAQYLIKFANGSSYYLEDGQDKLTTKPKKAAYIYANGDSHLNIYYQELYDEQMGGGTSSRPRWAWFLESEHSDPYHVKIYSKQATSYQSADHHLYLRTYEQHFNQDASADTKHVVTGGTYPVITDNPATEYMILGTTAHNYKLVTTYLLDGSASTDVTTHTTVTNFEQYWKTYNMIKQHVLGISTDTDVDSNDASTFVVPTDPASYRTTLTAKDWHSYDAFAYAVRWNGYNDKNEHNKKAYETLEHWFQTIDMGDGTFDIIEADIPPVLVLLDNHGWEIMRKPMPTSSSDRAAKLAAIRMYNSPMVKAYSYYTSVKKATGHHKYYDLKKPVAISSTTYTTTDLGNLPPSTATNVLDAYGAQNDLFVTYTVKDEYADSYSYSYDKSTDTETITSSKFIVRQGGYYASDESGTLTSNAIPSGGLSKMIVDANGSIAEKNLWYVQPNNSIDDELGIVWATSSGNTAEPFTQAETKEAYKEKSGFDPYNIQLKNASTGNFFTTSATGAELTEGALVGTGSTTVTLSSDATSKFTMSNYHDHSKPKVTNQTFMAVQDENGNMQLMPRFDHTVRVDNFGTLAAATTVAADDEAGSQTTFFVRPLVYEYIIVDNQGRDALHYKTGGEYYPDIPSHFQSPQASDYAYYKTLTLTDNIYTEVRDKTDISGKQITGSFAAAGLTDNSNTVYVRYSYDPVGDNYHYYTLEGAWYTLQLNNKWMKYDSGIKQGDSKPATGTDLNAAHDWQWKFRQTPYSDIDPYAVELYNRSYNASNRTSPLPSSDDRFALLSHTTAGYALVKCGTGSTDTYQFLNGASMEASTAASITAESGFNTYSSIITAGSQILLTDEITPSYTYHVYTNGTNGDNEVKYGSEAISATQTWDESTNYNWEPYLPESAQTPLLRTDDYLYYEAIADMGNSAKEIETIFGLYDDNVYVRYNAYDPNDENYLVPNKRNTPLSAEIAVDAASNPSPININGELVYNIFWKTNNMMQSTDDTNITAETNHDLDGGTAFVWTFEGNDPYAIKIKHQKAEKYVDGTSTLNSTAKNFMLLKKDGYEYGVLQVTGVSGDDVGKKLTGFGESLTENASTDPAEFIIFALSTHKVIYHLVIENINKTEEIPFYDTTDNTLKTWDVPGSTKRDLTNYLLADVDAGQVSLGAKFDTPTSSTIYRPNCHYDYYIHGIYDSYTDESTNTPNETLNNLYKGHKLTDMPSNAALIGKTVRVNVVYSFDTSLTGSNKGGDFVKTVDKYWYTFDAKGTGSTVYLAQYTNAWGLQGQEGRSSRYTNDYLWTPLGDPYGFVMHNRYVHKNGGNTDYVMTTKANDIGAGVSLFVGKPGTTVTVSGSTFTPAEGNEIFELLSGSTLGYFYVHPVKNSTGTKYYVTRDASDGYLKLTTSGSQWTFGLDITQLKPYFDRKGYVGGLTQTAYEDSNNAELVEAINNGSLTYDQLVKTQELVYTDANIQPYAIGYYRMHAQPDVPSISNVRYASGYLHNIELTAGEGSTAIPMHFYSRKGVTTVFQSGTDNNALNSGFTSTAATRGDIPILATEDDPSTIFYFPDNDVVTDLTRSVNGVPTSKMMTQGLYAYNNAMSTSSYTTYYIMDIGGATLLIHDGSAPASRKYLCFDQSEPVQKTATDNTDYTTQRAALSAVGTYYFKIGSDSYTYKKVVVTAVSPIAYTESDITETDWNSSNGIYDLMFKHDTPTDDAKWCMEPAKNQSLVIPLNNGGDGHYYATFYAPFDVLLPTENDKAYVCNAWDTSVIYPKAVGESNTGTYAGNDKFIPAGTPVIIRSTNSDDLKLTIPTTSPTTSLSRVFKGTYLEQLLSTDITSDDKVYTFGLPITGISMNYEATAGENWNGDVSGVSGMVKESAGVGFYINATPNKERNMTSANWVRNNRYVLHNKVYYRAPGGGSAPRRQQTRSIEFIPVVFDGEPIADSILPHADNCQVYDLSGRCVATGQEVQDGTWHRRVTPGIYILNGRKVVIK